MLHTQPHFTPWWREPEVLWLTLLIAVVYFARLSTLDLRGEETRRAQVAVEMLESGDWVVPRLQGELYRTRPPLGNWLIALGGAVRGKVDVIAIRLPTLIAVLLTTLLLYGYARNHLTRLGATAAAVAYATMGQVLQIGRVAESEGVFTLFIAASLLVWRWGYLKRWPSWVMWSAGYALAALAGLTKGPQGPVYFVLPVVAYLLWRRDWRRLFSPGHAAGIGAFALVLGSWQVPYLIQTDVHSVVMIWTKQATNRFSTGFGPVAKHMLSYPLLVLACMLPWSLALLHVFNRRFRAAARDMRDELAFLAIGLAVTFPSVWLAVGAEPRYFMPMYPLVAVICGTVIDRSIGREMGLLNLGWKAYLAGCGIAALVGAAVFAGARHLPPELERDLAQPFWFTAIYAVFAVPLCAFLLTTIRSEWRARHEAALLAIGFAVGLTYCGAVLNAMARNQRDVRAAVAQVKDALPADVPLVSFGPVNHAFVFHYGRPIPVLQWPADAKSAPYEFFCFTARDRKRKLPFAWREVTVIAVHNSGPPDDEAVVIGRRLTDPRTAAKTGPVRN